MRAKQAMEADDRTERKRPPFAVDNRKVNSVAAGRVMRQDCDMESWDLYSDS